MKHTVLVPLAVVLTISFLFSGLGLHAAEADARLFELRIYQAGPGKLDALHARFRDHTCALFDKHGMTQLGYFVPVDNEELNILVYWLAYPDMPARKAAWDAFLNDPDWKAAYAASIKDGKLVAEVKKTFLRATDFSPEMKAVIEDPARIFEWRTYTTVEGRLDAINARFRDHTCALFEKHGITNIAYWNYQAGQEAAEVTLTYLVAHKDQDSRDASFKAFGADPGWKAARDASVADGPILIKKGVNAVMLQPTDYSPMK